MKVMKLTALRSATAAGLMLAVSCALAASPRLPGTTPTGITLVEVISDGGSYGTSLLWVRLGDADGRTVLMFDQDRAGESKCVAACAQEFAPLLALGGASAVGDWSVVVRADGTRQWAYQSHPLYSWVKEKEPGAVAQNVAMSQRPNSKAGGGRNGGGSALMPPQGWQVVHFDPGASLSLPDGIDTRLVMSAQAVTLVDVSGQTLYAFDGDVKRDGQNCGASGCDTQWIPLIAPAMASGTGDFSILTRIDGTRQWAYQGRPLYTYKGDTLPGDVFGAGIDRRWNVVEVTRNFRPAHVAIRTLEGYGDVLTFNGMTLYGGYPFEKRWGGRNLRGNFAHNAYYKGKMLGGAACVDAECLQSWHPLLAAADAQATGFWEPIKRPDGTRQWTYKGYAMYTYAGDRAPGDHTGQAVYAFDKAEGNERELKDALFVQSISKAAAGVGIYWSIAEP